MFTRISRLNIAKEKDQEGFQIDLIIDRKDDTINLCEIKFYDSVYIINKKEYDQLQNRKTLFREYAGTKKQIFTTMISSHGIRENEYARDVVDSEVRLEDFF